MADGQGKPNLLDIVGRLMGLGAALAGAPSSALAAQMVAPSAAPVEWVRYAQGAAAAVTALLQADNEAAVQLRAYLDQTRPAPDQPTAPLIVKLWVAKDGKVSKIDFTPFSHPAPNADLRALLVGQRLPGMLPKGMLLPLRIAVQLDTLPAPAPVADPGPNSV